MAQPHMLRPAEPRRQMFVAESSRSPVVAFLAGMNSGLHHLNEESLGDARSLSERCGEDDTGESVRILEHGSSHPERECSLLCRMGEEVPEFDCGSGEITDVR
jgi:hypothetical protein